jgi:sulfonate transport system substrate-binding protein
MKTSTASRVASLRRLVALTLAVFGLLTLLASSAGASSKAKSGNKLTAAAVPAGTVLRIGDQLNGLETLLKADNDETFPFTVDWSSFLGGPPMLQAFQANAIDVGIVGTTPPIFAQAANQGVVAIAAYGTAHSADDLVSAPGVSVSGWKSLKGKPVAYQQGTIAEAVVLAGLHSVGLKLTDITTVNLPSTEEASALENHSAAAAVMTQPLVDGYLAQNPTAKIVLNAPGASARLTYIIASKAALASPAKSAAIADLLTNLVKSYTWINAHPTSYVESEFVKEYGLTVAAGTKLMAELGKTTFVPINQSLYAAQQEQANLFTAAGEIPSHVNVTAEFNPKFNSVIAAAQKS